ncbi:Hpt domain-containing protein, partial [Acinetobacter baumannii]
DGLKEVRRLLHTIKGAAAAFYIKRIRDCAHTFESEIATLEGGTETLPPDEVARKLEYYAKRLEAELNRFLSEQRELLGPHFEK